MLSFEGTLRPRVASIVSRGREGAEEYADFRALYERYLPLVWKWAFRLGAPADALDDVVQETFLTIHRRLHEFEGRSSLRTWVFGITLGVTRNHRRRQRATAMTESEVDQLVSSRPHPEAAAEHTEALALLRRILDGIDDDRREVFVLAELEQMSMTEIASVLSISANTVSSRLRRAREDVRAAWERARARDGWRSG